MSSIRPGKSSGAPSAGGNTILVVARRTGIAMDTLRAWERRYGFPAPERREGSNRRLYSEADVERLVAMKRAIDAGYRIGDVVGMPAGELDALAGGVPAPVAANDVDDVASLLGLLRSDDAADLELRLSRALDHLGPARFVVSLAHPLAIAVGDAWARGEINVHHEHLVSELLTTQLRRALAAHQTTHDRPLVLLATLAGELHGLGLQMVAVLLAVHGARPRLIGTSTPVEELLAASRAYGADAVGVTVTAASDRVEARRDLKRLRKGLDPRVALWVGGELASSVAPEGARVVQAFDALRAAVAALR